MKENLKEKGSISLFVLITCLFFTVILGGVYIASMNKLHVQEQSVSQIQENYTRNVAAAGEYASGMTTMSKEEILEIVKEYIETNTDYVSKTEILDKTYPIGSIYISTSSTNPGNLFGGTWQNYGQGRTLVGIDSSQSKFATVNATGGNSTVKLTTANLPSHNHSIPSLSGSTSSSGSHSHTAWVYINQSGYGTTIPVNSHFLEWGGAGWTGDTLYDRNVGSFPTNASGGHTHSITTNASTTGSTGSTTAFDVQNPYVVVYMWKRVS